MMDSTRQKILGRDHYYLTEALLAEAENNDISTADLFSMGEDEFIAESFIYSMVLSTVFYNNDIDPSEEYFRIIKCIATFFWKVTLNMDKGDMECPLISADQFRVMLKETINTPTAKLPLDGHYEKPDNNMVH